jgi:hypothetical protein
MVVAVETTQWIIAAGSIGSALIALALALGLKEWVFRPRVRLALRHESDPEENSDRIVTKRLRNGEAAAYVRLRLVNVGRTTARNVAVNILRVHRWDPVRAEWIRSRPELDGRAPQPSNQLEHQPDLVDVFPHTDRILDLASVDLTPSPDDAKPIFVEITQPWPPNEANVLDAATWRLELLVCGDNIKPERSFFSLSFDGTLAEAESAGIWDHFVVQGPFHDISVSPATQGNAEGTPVRARAGTRG